MKNRKFNLIKRRMKAEEEMVERKIEEGIKMKELAEQAKNRKIRRLRRTLKRN